MSLVRGRKVRDEADARECLALARTASSVNAWCRANGVSAADLYTWRRRLNLVEGKPTEETIRFVEVTEVTEVRKRPARYKVVLGRATVVVDDDFQVDTLRRLLEVLGSC